MNIAQLRTDEVASTKGKWFDFDEGVSFLIAANNNPAHAKAMGKIAQKRGRALRKNNIEAATALFVESLPGTVLLGWKGLTHTPEGTTTEMEYPFSRDNALALMRTSREVKDFIIANANDLAAFAADAEATAAGELKSEAPVGA